MTHTLTVVAAPALLLSLACAARTHAESGDDEGIDPTGCATLVHDGDFEASSDAELEALRGVTHVTGHLYISEGVTSLEPASCVQGVGTMLAISDTKSLTSLHGLEAFE